MDHELFKRKGDDLYFRKKISLIESLQGFQFNFKSLDDFMVTLKSEGIVRHGDIKMLESYGMPHKDDALSNGNLYIIFDVEMPKQLSQSQLDQLSKILPKKLLPEVQVQKSQFLLKSVDQKKLKQ